MLSFFRKKSTSESTTADDIIPKLEELATNPNNQKLSTIAKVPPNSVELLKQLGYNTPGELKETIYGKSHCANPCPSYEIFKPFFF